MFLGWNLGGGSVFHGKPASGKLTTLASSSLNKIIFSSTNSGNCQIVIGGAILLTTLILFCIYNVGISFTLDEGFQMERGRLEPMPIVINENFLVEFELHFEAWCTIIFNYVCRISSLLDKCLYLQHYFVTIPISDTGETILLPSPTFRFNCNN